MPITGSLNPSNIPFGNLSYNATPKHPVDMACGWLVAAGGFASGFLSATGPQAGSKVLSPWFWTTISICTAVYYANIAWLFPHLYVPKKYVHYFGLFVLTIVLVNYLAPFDRLMGQGRPAFVPPPIPGNNHVRPRPPGGPGTYQIDIVSIILVVMVWFAAMARQTLALWQRSQQRAAEAEAHKAQAELSFLKAQIHPHFLFNTLNNIYSLAVNANPATADAILKLSGIMRYVTDDATEEWVPLESELACIKNYIDLQKLRTGGQTNIQISAEGHIKNTLVAPMLLMTFVENAFKHGISKHQPGTIGITVKVQGNTIHFGCSNPVVKHSNVYGRQGIGLENTQQRLQLLYPGRHLLHINHNANQYTVHLDLQSNT